MMHGSLQLWFFANGVQYWVTKWWWNWKTQNLALLLTHYLCKSILCWHEIRDVKCKRQNIKNTPYCMLQSTGTINDTCSLVLLGSYYWLFTLNSSDNFCHRERFLGETFSIFSEFPKNAISQKLTSCSTISVVYLSCLACWHEMCKFL